MNVHVVVKQHRKGAVYLLGAFSSRLRAEEVASKEAEAWPELKVAPASDGCLLTDGGWDWCVHVIEQELDESQAPHDFVIPAHSYIGVR
jgi:hypothetical protein